MCIRDRVIAACITGVVVAVITWIAATQYRIKSYESKIGSAEEKSREIIDEALKVAETKKREACLLYTSKILIDDGLIELEVKEVNKEDIVCTVVNGGELGERKGVNVRCV